MTNVTTIDFDNTTVKIDQELFQGYLKEAFEYLGEIEVQEENLKGVIETVAENTGLKPAKVKKYIKERFAAKTKATKELGELFAKLDEVLKS